jgi:hypothetical protein
MRQAGIEMRTFYSTMDKAWPLPEDMDVQRVHALRHVENRMCPAI